jgi:hypothetical protein
VFLEVGRVSQRDFATGARVPQATISRFLAGASLGETNGRKVAAALVQPDRQGRATADLADEILWACRNVERMRDTDVLPRPHEFGLLSTTPVPILAALGSIDLATHVARTPRTFVAPKMSGGFRRVTQLDPTDTLLYGALVHSVAPAIEASRATVDQVFSFRAADRNDGYLWRDDVGWAEFVQRGQALAADAEHPVVLVADIADFYSQIDLSTVTEALEDAGVPSGAGESIGHLIRAFAGRRGRGLPTGPHPSALLAEVVLGRLDRHLERTGRPFVRFVDDIRIFCRHERDAFAAWHHLAAFLAERLGLSLNDSKTRVQTAAEFSAAEDAALYADPQELPIQNDVAEHGSSSPDSNDWQDELHLIYLQEFRRALRPREGSLRSVRRLLRRAPSTSLDPLLLDPDVLVQLVPVLRELAFYLLKPGPNSGSADLGSRLLWLADQSKWADIPFVRLWIAEVLATRFASSCGPALEAFLRRAQPDIGLSAAAMLASVRGDREWVRAHEQRWESLSPWDRRAVFSAAKILSPSERERWAQRAEENPARDPLLLVLASEVRSGVAS